MSRGDRSEEGGRRYRYLDGLRLSWRLLRPHRGLFLAVLAIASVAALLNGVGDPVFLKILIDSLSAGDLQGFVWLAAGLLVIYTLMRVGNYFAAVLRQRLKNQITEDLALGAFDTFYDLPYGEVSRRDRGYFISRIYEEPSELTRAVDLAVQLVSSTVLFTGAVVVCFWLSWQVSIVLSVVVPVLLWVAHRFGAKITDTTVQEKEEEAVFRDDLGRAVESWKTARLFALGRRVRRGLGGRLRSYLDVLYTRVRQSSLFQAISGTFLSYAEMAVLVGAGIQVLRGVLTIGGMFGFITAYWRVVNAFRAVVSRLPTLAELSGNAARLEDFERLATTGERSPADAASGGSILLPGVNFAYEEQQVLENLTLTVEPGQRVLVEGENGSGKSTAAHIACGLLPAAGEAADAVRVPPLTRMSAALVPFGFVPGTVADNLALDDLSEERRRRTLALAAEIGVAGKLDQDPASLSAGEKKKLQVLMALNKDADHYLFDEPLANVDAASRPRLMDVILRETAGKGLVVILHDAERYRDRFDRRLDLGAPVAARGEERSPADDPHDDSPTETLAEAV